MLATPHLNLLNKFLLFVITLALLAGLVSVPSFADSPSFTVTFSSQSGRGNGTLLVSDTFIAPSSGYYFAYFQPNGDFFVISDPTYNTSYFISNSNATLGEYFGNDPFNFYYGYFTDVEDQIKFVFTGPSSVSVDWFAPVSLDFYPAGSPGEPVDPSDPSSPLVPSDGNFPTVSSQQFVEGTPGTGSGEARRRTSSAGCPGGRCRPRCPRRGRGCRCS